MNTRRQFLVSAAAALPAFANPDNVQILSAPAGGIQPQVALVDGILHLISFSGEPKRGDVFYRLSSNFGRTFSSPIQVNSKPGTAIAVGSIRGAQISVAKGNQVHVAWNAADGSAMYYAQLDEKHMAFEPQRNLMQQTFGLDGGGSVTSDQNGNVYVGWHGKAPGAKEGEAGRQVWIAQSRDQGRTFERERTIGNPALGACGCCGLRLFADSRGDVYGLYRSATENVHRDIYRLHSSDNAKTFTTALVQQWEINACPMSSMSFLETPGGVLGAWETQTQVYFDRMNRAALAPIAPPGDRPKRKYPVLARNKRGETLMAWVDGSAWQRGGTLGWQIFDAQGKPGATCTVKRDVPVWSFPAVFVRPDDGFAVMV